MATAANEKSEEKRCRYEEEAAVYPEFYRPRTFGPPPNLRDAYVETGQLMAEVGHIAAVTRDAYCISGSDSQIQLISNGRSSDR